MVTVICRGFIGIINRRWKTTISGLDLRFEV